MTAPTYRSLLAANLPPVLWMGVGFGLGASPIDKGFGWALAFAAWCAVWFGLLLAVLVVVEWGVRRAVAEWVAP